MSATANSDIFNRIPLLEAKLNFELDKVKPGSFKDSEIALHRYCTTSTGKLFWFGTSLTSFLNDTIRAVEAVNVLKRLEEIKEMRLRREGSTLGRGVVEDRKL